MEGIGDGHSGGVLHLGAGGQKDLRPCLLQVLYQMSGSKMLLMFLTHIVGISPPCEKLERCALHLHVETKSLVFLGLGIQFWGPLSPHSAGDSGWRLAVLQCAVGQPARMCWTGAESHPKLSQA